MKTALAMTGNLQDAQDAAQEAFLRFFKNLDRIDTRSAPKAWLKKITVNSSLRLLEQRKRNAEQTSEQLEHLPTPYNDPLLPTQLANLLAKLTS